VIRSPKDYDPNGNLYDYDLPEHKIFISDWLHLPADDHFPGLRGANSGQDANSFLINGKGRTLVRHVKHKYSMDSTEIRANISSLPASSSSCFPLNYRILWYEKGPTLRNFNADAMSFNLHTLV
jgi:hypothetical protein